MNTMRWEKHAPLTGVVSVVLFVIGYILIKGPVHRPKADTSARALDLYKHNHIPLGAFLIMLGVLFFLWFLGSLRATLHSAEGGVGRLATIAGGGGLAAAISILLMPGPLASGEMNRKHLSDGAAQAFVGISNTLFLAAELAVVVLLVGTALVALRTGVLPQWLAWISLVVALWLLIPPIGWAALLFAVPLWVIAVALLIYGRPIPPPAPPPHTSQFVGSE
jgi:hypothetical protein